MSGLEAALPAVVAPDPVDDKVFVAANGKNVADHEPYQSSPEVLGHNGGIVGVLDGDGRGFHHGSDAVLVDAIDMEDAGQPGRDKRDVEVDHRERGDEEHQHGVEDPRPAKLVPKVVRHSRDLHS